MTPERIAGKRVELSPGLSVLRVLPTRQRRMIGAWCFLDIAGPVQGDTGMNVGPHPHIGLQTFTWMIAGELLHRDSLGFEQLIRPGQVNLMTAGSGIAHAEESLGPPRGMFAVQLWIALPEAMRDCAPDFQHCADLPRWQEQGLQLTLLAGEGFGRQAPTRVHTPLIGVDIVATDAAALNLPLRQDFEHGLLCLSGQANIDGDTLAPGALLYLPPGRQSLVLQSEAAAHLLLIGGVPFAENILMWWNFVARTPEEIERASEDWQAGRRFGTVIGSTLARIAAPDVRALKLRQPPTRDLP